MATTRSKLFAIIVIGALLVSSIAAAIVLFSPPQATPTRTPASPTSPTPAATTPPHTVAVGECKEWITLTILTRHPTEILEKTRQLFLESDTAKRYCVKDLNFVQLPPGWWIGYIRNHTVDVAWGGGPTLFDSLLKAGVLKPLEGKLVAEAIKQIPDKIAGAPTKRVVDGRVYWVAAALASFGFTVNRDVAKRLGYDWHELETWKNLASDDLGLLMLKTGVPVLGIADPTMSTSNTRMYEIILQAYGWEEGWRTLILMGANAKIYSGSSDVRDAVITGERMVGITIDFYGYTAQKLNPACIYILPKGETIVNGDPIAVTISTKYPEAAEAFVAWVLTEGQKVWLDPSINRLPVNPKVFETPEGKKRQDLHEAYLRTVKAKAMQFNDTLALMYEDAMRLYFKATIVDINNVLKNAWVALLKAYYVEKRIDEKTFEELKDKLTSLPTFVDPVTGEQTKFTIQYAVKVNQVLLKQPGVADKLMDAWREAARKQYLEVLNSLGG